MRNKRLELGILFLISFGFTAVHAQESINTTGGNASGSGGSASFSVGQLLYQTHTGTNGSVSEGVQQPFEISEVASTEEAKEINISVSVYPNPTTHYLRLIVETDIYEDASFKLIDLNGKLVQTGAIVDAQTIIMASNLVSATYFLKVIHNNKKIITFKIIKK